MQIMDWKDGESSFAPVIINSVRSSMQRSGHFNDVMSSAENKLSVGNANKTMFHSTVG